MRFGVYRCHSARRNERQNWALIFIRKPFVCRVRAVSKQKSCQNADSRMGCGQSKIGNIYSKNKKNKNNSTKKNGSGDSIRSASIEQKNGSTKSNKTNNNGAEVNRNEDNQNGSVDVKSQAKKKSGGPGSGPLLQQAEVSSSQLDFFKMLDEKIENGPDYDESMDATMKAERISDLMRRWELASMSWSSVADLNNSTTLLDPTLGLSNSRQSLSAKDREGMRNIIGGRPESAPVFTRNANRVDGLQEVHSPSPNMPRHVLESITQSPTQSLKNNSGTPPSSTDSPRSLRYHQDYNVKEYNANGPANVGGVGGGGRVSRSHYQSQAGPVNGEYVAQQALYREQYLQQTGIIAVQPQYVNTGSPVVGNVLRNNPYVQQFQLATSPQHFSAPRKRGFNAAQMT